jgi:hypothetical protein
MLCIGVQKSGTTWLYNNLRRHPDVWLSPVKEVHYFDRSSKYQSPSYLETESLLARIVSLKKNNIRFKKKAVKLLGSCFQPQPWADIVWKLKFVFGQYNDQWYSSLFAEKNAKIVGEITPSYSILDPQDIRKIRAQFPNVKIILLLRSPIERVWSNIRYKWSKNLIEDLDNEDLIVGLVNSQAVEMRTDYMKILSNWQACFSAEQMYIGYYDDLVQETDHFFREILKFLGLDEYAVPLSHAKINPSKKSDIPLPIHRYLAEKYLEQLVQLNELLGGHTSSWLKDAQKILTDEQ